MTSLDIIPTEFIPWSIKVLVTFTSFGMMAFTKGQWLLMKKKVNEILSKHTGKNLKTVESDTDRDNFLNAKEAKKYGIIDDILEERG